MGASSFLKRDESQIDADSSPRRNKMPNSANTDGNGRRIVSATADSPTLARTKHVVTIITVVLFSFNCFAQDQAQTNASAAANSKAQTIAVPTGTRFALVLTNPVSTKTLHRGDQVYAQTTAPVLVGDRAVIPAGVFVQGKINKITRNGSRAEMEMSSAAVVFPDGYIANIAGPLNVESDEGTAWRDPSSKARAGAIIAPIAGVGLGALIGRTVHTTQSASLGGTTITSATGKGVAIGSGIGLAIGAAVSIAILLNSRRIFVDVGSPMEMTLPQPLVLSENQVAIEVRQAQEHPAAVPMASPRPLVYGPYNRGICYMPGTVGTPPTIIPGTPSVGDNPGTPATVIPGTPGTPRSSYPCP
jgi:hypothetical protein